MPYRPPERSKQRKSRAMELRFGGATYQEIADALEITRQRAQRLLVPNPKAFEYIRDKASGKCEDCNAETNRGDIHDRRATGLEPDSYHKLENLIYLCFACHAHKHGIAVPAGKLATHI